MDMAAAAETPADVGGNVNSSSLSEDANMETTQSSGKRNRDTNVLCSDSEITSKCKKAESSVNFELSDIEISLPSTREAEILVRKNKSLNCVDFENTGVETLLPSTQVVYKILNKQQPQTLQKRINTNGNLRMTSSQFKHVAEPTVHSGNCEKT